MPSLFLLHFHRLHRLFSILHSLLSSTSSTSSPSLDMLCVSQPEQQFFATIVLDGVGAWEIGLALGKLGIGPKWLRDNSDDELQDIIRCAGDVHKRTERTQVNMNVDESRDK